MDKNILYDDLVFTIINILKKKNLENKLKPYIYQEDKKILHNFFLKPILDLNKNNLTIEWSQEQWIESMKCIRLGLLSFLYKNNATLYKIYDIIKDDQIQSHILLEKYKNLVYNLLLIEKMSRANKFLYEENVLLDDLQNKNYYLLLNIKNIIEPKYLSCIIDLFSHKEYRKNIVQYIFNGMEKVDLNELIDVKEDTGYDFLENILNNLEKNNIYNKMINFIMLLNLNGEILIKKDIYNKIQNYVNELINNSNLFTSFFNNLNNEYKKNPSKFKNEIKILYLPEHLTFTSKKEMNKNHIKNYKDLYDTKKNIVIEDIKCDYAYLKTFLENKKYVFSRKDIQQRIVDLIALLIENISVNYFDTRTEKINKINEFFNKINLTENFDIGIINKEELSNLLKNIKENGGLLHNTENYEENYENKEILKETINNIKENLKTHKDTKYFYETLSEFIFILYNIDSIDITNISKENFNICYEMIKKVTEDIDKFKSFCFHILDKENFTLFLSYIEKKNIFKINKVIKEKIVEMSLKLILEMVNFINTSDEENTKMFTKWLIIFAKIFDYIIFYLKKIKQKQNQDSNVKNRVKKQVVFK